MNLDAVFLIGPQGSGKGTQARILAEKHNLFYWEMGGVLRNLATELTPLGQEVKELINSGVLLTDDLLLSVFRDRMSVIPNNKGVIFDGVPRRIGQAEFVLSFLKEQGRSKFATLFIDLPKEESMSRLLLRAQKEGRKDDTKEAIAYRLQQYEEDTVPVLDFLKLNSDFITIDGNQPIEKVTLDIEQALAKYE